MGKLRKIDTWYYDVKDVQSRAARSHREDEEEEAPVKKQIITRKIEINLFLEKDTTEEGDAPYMLKKVNFIVKCGDPEFKLEGTDIEALRTAAFENLDEHFQIKWENYYLVTVNTARDYGSGISTGLTFSYDDVEKGVAWNGQELLRQYAWRGERVIKPWPGRFSDKNGQAIACIPATPANEAALQEFAKRIDTLRKLIRDTIKPENIIRTLANLSQLALLPPAPEEEKEAAAG